MTSPRRWSRYDRHFVGIIRHNALSYMARIYRVVQYRVIEYGDVYRSGVGTMGTEGYIVPPSTPLYSL